MFHIFKRYVANCRILWRSTITCSLYVTFNPPFFTCMGAQWYTLFVRSGATWRLGCLSDIIVSLSAAVVLSAVVVVSCVWVDWAAWVLCSGRWCLFVGRPEVFVLRGGGWERGSSRSGKLACWRECIKLTDRFLRLIIYFLVLQIT